MDSLLNKEVLVMKKFLEKLTSRKFIVTAITTITGIITMIVGESEIVNTIASALMVVIPTVVYCITEGVIDAKSVKTITDTVVETAEKLGVNESTVEIIETIGEAGEKIVDSTTKND